MGCRSILSCVAFLTLGACGGGGGGGSSSSAAAINCFSVASGSSGVTTSHLVISEVSACYYYNVDCWLEIYNPTNSSVNLSTYQLKSSSIDTTTGASAGAATTFSLPSISIAANSYAVISGNTGNLVQRSDSNIRLRTGNVVPWWSTSGFIELINSSATIDFVKFGTSSQTPTTASAWTGSQASAMSYTSSSYGQSMVRLASGISSTDTNTAADWTQVSYATPGGANDVPACAGDADSDGIPDTAEASGGTYAGLDLYAMGARTSQRDLFIEVDYMSSSDAGVTPRLESLQKVVDAFSAQSISVHFDAGTQFSGTFSTASFNLGQGSNVVTYEPCVTLNQTTCSSNTSDRRSLYDWKEESMDIRRRSVFHYLLFGNSQLATGASGSSGVAELPGNDFIVSMGNWGFSTTAGTALNKLINQQASTVMHELGHNLGLLHGGFENTNYKPNYWSVMNYNYQLLGLESSATTSTAYQRWRYYNGDNTIDGSSSNICALVNSPCGSASQFVMSYSNGSSASLTESALSESANLGRGNAGGTTYADWNLSGTLTAGTISRNLNSSYDSTLGTLSDYNDWANLTLPFVRTSSGNTGATINASATTPVASTSSAIISPLNQDRQPASEETAPPAHLLEAIRNAQ